MSNTQTNKSSRLWRDPGKNRYYLIPDDDPPPHGPLVLKSITGRTLNVDPDGAAAFEVDRDIALDWMNDRLRRGLDDFRDSTIDWLKLLYTGDRQRRDSVQTESDDDRIPLSVGETNSDQSETTKEDRQKLASLLHEIADSTSKTLHQFAERVVRAYEHP